MKLKRRIAAIAVAMTMAVSSMVMTACAETKSGVNGQIIVSGTTTHTSTADGIIYGVASGKVTNITSNTRYIAAQIDIYNRYNVYQTQSYKFGNASNKQYILSGSARDYDADCAYAVSKGVIYRNAGTTQGGEDSHYSVRVDF